MEQNDRITRIEDALVAIHSVGAQQRNGGLGAIVQAIQEDRDNTPNAEGHSPKMLRDWQRMVDEGVAKGKIPAAADTDLDDFFGRIERGEIVCNEAGDWVPA